MLEAQHYCLTSLLFILKFFKPQIGIERDFCVLFYEIMTFTQDLEREGGGG